MSIEQKGSFRIIFPCSGYNDATTGGVPFWAILRFNLRPGENVVKGFFALTPIADEDEGCPVEWMRVLAVFHQG